MLLEEFNDDAAERIGAEIASYLMLTFNVIENKNHYETFKGVRRNKGIAQDIRRIINEHLTK